MLPVFDVIFGTPWKLEKDKFPAIGLDTGEKAIGFLEGIIWPVRHKLPVQRLEPIGVTGGTKYCPVDIRNLFTILTLF
jgi:hypothetical protein